MRSTPPGRSPNGGCSFGEMKWGWIGSGFATKLDRPFHSSLGDNHKFLLSRVVAPAPCDHILKKIPQDFVDSEPIRSRRGPGHLWRLDLRSVVTEQRCFVITDRPRVLAKVAGVVYAARQPAEVFSLDCLQEMRGNSGGLLDFFQRNSLLVPRASEVQLRFRVRQLFDVGSHHSLPRIELAYRSYG